MNAGKYRHFGSYEMRLDVAFTAFAASTGYGVVGYGELYAGQTPTQFGAVVKSIDLKVQQYRDGAGIDQLTYTLDIPGVYSGSSSSFTFAATTYARLVFTNLKLYWFGTYWELYWDSIDWYTGAALFHTVGTGSIDSVVWEAKSAVPLLGIQPCLTAGMLAQNLPAPPGAGGISGTVLATGGWRFQESGSGTWQTPPVTMDVRQPLQIGACPVGVYPTLVPTATNTFDGSVGAYVSQTFSAGGGLLTSETYGNSLWLFDDCPSSIARLGSDYRAMWYRGGQPQTEHLQTGDCSGAVTNTYTVEHPTAAELLSTVGNSAHAIEDVFGYPLTAPYEMFGSKYDSGIGSHSGSSAFPGRVTFGGTELPYYHHHSDNVANYANYWGARHCHFLFWFPDDLGAGVQWPVLGITPSVTEFWLPESKQWLSHPSLPGAEDRKSQNNLVFAPLLKGLSASVNFVKSSVFTQARTSWVGLHNFTSQKPVVPASITLDLDSELAWSFTSCTAAFAAGGITLTPVAMPATVEAVFDAGLFGVEPYEYPLLAESVTVDWDTANVSALSVYLVDSLGKELLLTSAAPPVVCPFTSAQDEYYAGSWAQDHGGGMVSNVGVDQLATGQSPAHMGDPAFVESFQMFTGRSAHKLKFVVTLTNPAVSVLLKYPKYTYCDNPDPVFVPECSAQVALLWPDGPGVRLGSWEWHHTGAVQDTPLVRPSLSRQSALDWLVTRRVLFEGIAGTSGLDAELATLFDATEGQTRALASTDTLAFWLPTS